MNSERPLEPNNPGENPEGWAELVDWEAGRADQLERELTAARAEIARLQEQRDSAVEYMYDLLAEWKWKQGAGERNDKQYCELSNFITAIDAARKSS